ncbi:hypothetical protein HanOQP8_Chr01g0011371 [Helianthus annuus]|nr:hypothetical protein HanOQP8_Chr01g0011371 [Helianthus annuus]
MLVDEPEEDETEVNVEGDQDHQSPEIEQLVKSLDDTLEVDKAAGEKVDDDKEKSSSDPEESDIDAESERWIRENYDPRDRDNQKKKKRSEDDKDETYVPSPEHVQDVQTPPSGGRKKSNSRKRVITPTAQRLKIKLKSKPIQETSQPPHQSPLSEPQPKSPHSSPPKQPSPPQRQPSPDILQSIQFSPQLRISTPIHEQPVITSSHILQTPPTTQPQVQTTPGSSGFKDFPHVPENIALEEIGDFSFVNDELVKKLQKKVEEVSVEKKKLEKHVKTVEAENSSLLKRVEADQADIDIFKVRIAELEEEKARRDKRNEYFKLKNKELEANNAKKEHESYMMMKVLENMIEMPIEQRFEEIELEEVRARRKAEVEVEMKNKGKGVSIEGVTEVTERAIVVSEPTIDPETFILDPCPISSVSGEFDDNDEDDEEDDEEENDDNIMKDDADEVYSANSDHDDDGNDDDDQGSTECKW